MKIIDVEVKGNAIRVYLGDDACDDYWGDDWNDTPYEHNAGRVYDKYVKSYFDILVPFDMGATTACDGYANSPYSKEDFKKGFIPCAYIVTKDRMNDNYGFCSAIDILRDNTGTIPLKFEEVATANYIEKLRKEGLVIQGPFFEECKKEKLSLLQQMADGIGEFNAEKANNAVEKLSKL